MIISFSRSFICKRPIPCTSKIIFVPVSFIVLLKRLANHQSYWCLITIYMLIKSNLNYPLFSTFFTICFCSKIFVRIGKIMLKIIFAQCIYLNISNTPRFFIVLHSFICFCKKPTKTQSKRKCFKDNRKNVHT